MTIRDIGRSLGNAVLQRVGRAASKVQESKPLPVDVLESEEAYLVVFDAPGATGSDVQVRYADGSVLVRIDRFRDYHEGFEMVFPGRGLSLDGQADLPADAVVNAEAATATLTEHGTLRVEVPKRAEETDESQVESVEADEAESADAGAADTGVTDAESTETGSTPAE